MTPEECLKEIFKVAQAHSLPANQHAKLIEYYNIVTEALKGEDTEGA